MDYEAAAQKNQLDFILAKVKRQKQFTPDMRKLEERDMHLLFVCDEMKQGFHEHHQLANQIVRVEHCFTKDPAFTMFTRDLGKFSEAVPLCLPTPMEQAPKARLKGELHLVSTERLMKLDIFKRNTIEFERRRVAVEIFYRPVTHSRQTPLLSGDSYEYSLPAWIYVGMNSYWEPLLDNGARFRRTRKFAKDGVVHPQSQFKSDYNYYSFTKMELDD